MILLDNDQPTISTPNPTPVEHTAITLTCTLATIPARDTPRGYEWYKDGAMILDTSANTYDIQTGRAHSGSYQCKALWVDSSKISELSDAEEVRVLCKFHTVFIMCRS